MPVHLLVLAQCAARHGLAARPIAKQDGGAYHRKIKINGWVCRVLNITPNHPGGYSGFMLMASILSNHDFFIITLRQVDKPTIYYVVPVARFKQLIKGRTTVMVYIPTRSHEIRRTGAVSWHHYRSAWHLLNKRR